MSADSDRQINRDIASQVGEYYADPLGFVLFAFPWGTGSLKGRDGPQKWQAQYLYDLGQEVEERSFNGVNAVEAIMHSTASGHGIGKSALVAWITLWILSTRPDSKGIITANTSQQLNTKTFAELAKWHSLCITSHWFEMNALSLHHKDAPKTWRVDGQTCREENSEAFAGLHAANSTPFYIFDEASAVPDKIFEVREGGLTDGEPMVFDFGNPTRNTGRFFENMKGRFRDMYTQRFIDSRTVEQTNKNLFKTWSDQYGEDSDFFKVRVKGEFPSAGTLQFIPTDLVDKSLVEDIYVGPTDPVIMGVDVARFGSDHSVIWTRHGRDCCVHPYRKFNGIDTMALASYVVEEASKHNPDAIFLDETGLGAGVLDRCRQLGLEVIGINFGAKATQAGLANMRAQMWQNLKDAMRDGIRLPDDQDLRADLTGVEYGFNVRNEIQLEKKDDMLKRGLASPDLADALALTYALPVLPNSRQGYAGPQYEATSAYNPFEDD